MVQTPIDEPMKMDGEKPSTSSFVKIKNESKKFKCPACRKSFKTAFELRKHDGKLEHVHYFSCKDFVLAGRPGLKQILSESIKQFFFFLGPTGPSFAYLFYLFPCKFYCDSTEGRQDHKFYYFFLFNHFLLCILSKNVSNKSSSS